MITSTVVRKEGSTLVGSCQFAQCKTSERLDQAFPSVRIAPLFYEFLGRYNDWRLAKLQVMIGSILVLFLGLFALIMPWFLPKVGVWISLVIFILFFFALRYYLVVNERASHLYINVYVLHHHLIGKLEVGFCDHHEPCHCVADFRGYVLKNYRISFESGSLR
ncbi:hypothetical protein [Desulfosporosinus sp. I2]|uniref:hypothetical protein n=1 Tax=Desulfosporosinus sp. I2 TaxID=1617025 RepID=UPI000AE94856|nr:hypothetical protein [Desulfosporosinus sp. I2]